MFMWLSGGQKPDFRTLNDFRGKLLKGVMEEIFVTAVKMLAAKGYIKLENYFVDGTRICGGRNSYSKTDPDATFMRMKEDHGGKGQPKPGYNVQIGTENGFVAGYDVFPNPTDTKTLKPHLKRQAKRLGVKPKAVIADAGYGSEENYAYLENSKTAAVVKYNTYHKEKSRQWKEDVLKTENWEYNRKGKYYVCPNGKKLAYRGTEKRKTEGGFAITVDLYECESCKYCRLKKQCAKTAGNRKASRNERMLRLRRKARRTLEDEKYKELRKRRSVEVETVFGQIKGNQGYRRFLLRGNEKVSAEWGLLVLGYNLKQIFRLNREKTA